MRAVVEGKEVKLPDFLIVGAARSGTTSLSNYLNKHNKIYMPTIKEPNFFVAVDKPSYSDTRVFSTEWLKSHLSNSNMGDSADIQDAALIHNFDDYLRLFERAKEGQICGEASVSYLYLYQRAIENIKSYIESYKDLKIIIILRNPIDRAYSHYLLNKMGGVEALAFEDTIDENIEAVKERTKYDWNVFDYLGYSLYYTQVKAYMDNFPHVKVYLFKDLKADSLGLVRDIFDFLGVDDTFVPDIGTKHNPSKEPMSWFLNRLLNRPNFASSIFPMIKLIPLEKRISITKKLQMLQIRTEKKGMNKKTRQRLKRFYRADILKLQRLIGRDLSDWLE